MADRALKPASRPSFANALKWAYAANWGERALGGGVAFVLAAILGPRNFGIIAIAMAYIQFLQMFLDQGLVAALIQKQDLEDEHLNSVFWVDLLLSVFLVAISIVLSGWWAAKNHAPDAAKLISVLSLCIPIEGLSSVQGAVLKRNMDFKSLSIRSNVAVLASGVVGLGMAFTGFGVWALVGQQLTRDLAAVVLLWKLSPWRPRLVFSWKHLRSLIGFSSSTFLAQLATFGEGQFAAVVLGFLFGPVAVGLYRLADRMVTSIVSIATTSIQSVSLPEFVRVRDDKASLKNSVFTCLRLGSSLTIPALTCLLVVSKPLLTALGSNWSSATDALRVLSVLGMGLTFAYFTGPLLQALSRPQHLAMLEWTKAILTSLSLVAAGLLVRNKDIGFQVTAISLARLVALTGVAMPVYLYVLIRLSGISLRRLLSAVTPAAASALGAVAAATVLHLSRFSTRVVPRVALTSEIFLFGTVAVTVLLACDAQLWAFIQTLFSKSYRRSMFASAGRG